IDTPIVGGLSLFETGFCQLQNLSGIGVYPLTPKLTQKSRNNTPQYPIPDSYIVETEVSERSLKCETKYISNSKKINQKLLTKRFGPCLFGFDIEPLYHARLQISSQPVTTIKNNKHKKPLEDITSRSQQYKQLNSLKRIYKK
ncbi:11248_t:CDS:2, partial [Gigaspora rosea]